MKDCPFTGMRCNLNCLMFKRLNEGGATCEFCNFILGIFATVGTIDISLRNIEQAITKLEILEPLKREEQIK